MHSSYRAGHSRIPGHCCNTNESKVDSGHSAFCGWFGIRPKPSFMESRSKIYQFSAEYWTFDGYEHLCHDKAVNWSSSAETVLPHE